MDSIQHLEEETPAGPKAPEISTKPEALPKQFWEDLEPHVRNVIIEETLRKVEALHVFRPKQLQFNYRDFQNKLKLTSVLHIGDWLKSQLDDDNLKMKNAHREWKFHPDLTFENIYGQIFDHHLCEKIFKSSSQQDEKEARNQLANLQVFSQRFGRFGSDRAIAMIEPMIKAKVEMLGMNEPFLYNCIDQIPLYAANPFKNQGQLDWLYVPRFGEENKAIPTEQNIVVVQDSFPFETLTGFKPGDVVIPGYSPALMFDVQIERPLVSTENSLVGVNVCVMIETLRKYPFGICAKLFASVLSPSADLDPNRMLQAYPDAFQRQFLPMRNSVILFHVGIPDPDAIQILKTFWTDIVNLVKCCNNGCLKTNDVEELFESFYSISLDKMRTWGFQGWIDFINWANYVWNEDQRSASIRIVPFGRRILRDADYDDVLTAICFYVPGSESVDL